MGILNREIYHDLTFQPGGSQISDMIGVEKRFSKDCYCLFYSAVIDPVMGDQPEAARPDHPHQDPLFF